MKHPNIILTGLPRSGTTLTCHLLNKVDNVVALHEPMPVNFSNKSTTEICDEISNFFILSRQTILQQKRVLSVHVSGKVPDNTFGNERNVDGLRKSLEGRNNGYISVEKELSADFILCIKHNGVFTFLLENLINYFPCYAIIRNPLSILASWNSIDLPINNGHIPAAEKLDTNLAHKLNTIPDKIDRQLYIMSWFFNHYKKWIPESNIIRYENVIFTGGASLKKVTPKASLLSESLKSKNNNELYNTLQMKILGERLLNAEGGFWYFYTRKAIEDLLNQS